jgi:hypothetical protein
MSSDGARAELCCGSGRSPQRPIVDVPTLTHTTAVFTIAGAAIDAIVAEHAPSIAPPIARFKIGASPPHLAAALRQTYLHTSVFLI